MAKINKGIFGPLTGKIGSFIGSTWLGIPYLKKAPVKDKNSKRSAAQIANSQKFGYVSRWLVPFHPFITVGFSTCNSQDRYLCRPIIHLQHGIYRRSA
jgi:hypothetical protein